MLRRWSSKGSTKHTRLLGARPEVSTIGFGGMAMSRVYGSKPGNQPETAAVPRTWRSSVTDRDAQHLASRVLRRQSPRCCATAGAGPDVAGCRTSGARHRLMGLLCSRRRAVLGAGAAWQVVDLSPSLPQTRRSRAWGPSLRGPTCSQVQADSHPRKCERAVLWTALSHFVGLTGFEPATP